MITVSDARRLILKNSSPGKVEVIPLRNARGYILAESVLSVVDTPPFNQSAMDGYAISFDEWDGKSDLKVAGEIQTGNYSNDVLRPMEAIRVYTGAALPSSADAVVMQERVVVSNDYISIRDEQFVKGTNVRLQGSQAKRGEVALREGQILTPAAISFLASIGVEKVVVYSRPVVSIIVTGKELVKPGVPLPQGKIYESNSFGLTAALNQIDIAPVSVQVVNDDEVEIVNAITDQLQSDIVILTGGVSVGDYDYVSGALEKCGIVKVFHKVKQKPGKPFYFGLHNSTMVFALPGNPAAVLSCFYEYVVSAISSFTKKDYFNRFKLPLANGFVKKPGLTSFLKGKKGVSEVTLLDHQESYLMNSFAVADCIVELEEEKEIFKRGDMVNIIMIV